MARSWLCLRRCAGCERCGLISVSIRYADCSWFHGRAVCTSAALSRKPSSFRTGLVGISTNATGDAGGREWRGVGRVTAALTSEGFDELDRLQRTRQRLPATGALALPLPAAAAPQLLLGLISGDPRRRRLLRCTWVGALPPEARARPYCGLGEAQSSPCPCYAPAPALTLTSGARALRHRRVAARRRPPRRPRRAPR